MAERAPLSSSHGRDLRKVSVEMPPYADRTDGELLSAAASRTARDAGWRSSPSCSTTTIWSPSTNSRPPPVSRSSAKNLAILLRYGPLPVNLTATG
jgi:preprotein translocase subunit SecD